MSPMLPTPRGKVHSADSVRGLLSCQDFVRVLATFSVDALGTGMFLGGSALFFTRSVGLSESVIGMGLAAAGVVGLFATVPAGVVSDRFGSATVLILVKVWRGTAFLIYSVATTPLVFVVAACLQAVGERASWPPVQSVVDQVVGSERRQSALGILTMVRNVGFALGAASAAVLTASTDPLLYRLVVLLNAASFFGAAMVLKPLRKFQINPQDRVGIRRPSRVQFIRPKAAFISLTLLNAVLSLHVSILSIGLPLWVVNHTEAPGSLVSWCIAVNALLAVLCQYRVSQYVRSFKTASLAAAISGMCLCLSCLLLAFSNAQDMGTAVAMCVFSVLFLTGGQILQYATDWWFSYELAPDYQKAAYVGFFNTGVGLQHIVGPVLFTSLVIPMGTIGWLVTACGFVLIGLGELGLRASRYGRG